MSRINALSLWLDKTEDDAIQANYDREVERIEREYQALRYAQAFLHAERPRMPYNERTSHPLVVLSTLACVAFWTVLGVFLAIQLL